MSESCSENCASCSQNCEKRDMLLPPNEYSTIKHVIGVVSGKGGVGKSLVTSLLAVAAQSKGFQTAILDADITGPSIPKAFGLHDRAQGDESGIFPMETKMGIRVMSVNLLLEKEDAPVIWRGPVISGMINQFWQEVIWGDIDYMFVDMPPGTGDVPLTVFQSLPLDGIIIVTTPQDLVQMIVKKAYNMAKMMNIPVLGLVENMSYLRARTAKSSIRFSARAKLTKPRKNSACRCSRGCRLSRKPPRWLTKAPWNLPIPTNLTRLSTICRNKSINTKTPVRGRVFFLKYLLK